MEEFFAQGDKEIDDGGFPTMNCDRVTTLQDELSLNFLDFIVAPIYFSTLKLIPGAHSTCRHLKANRDAWHNLLSERLIAAGQADVISTKWEPRKKGFDAKYTALKLDGDRKPSIINSVSTKSLSKAAN